MLVFVEMTCVAPHVETKRLSLTRDMNGVVTPESLLVSACQSTEFTVPRHHK